MNPSTPGSTAAISGGSDFVASKTHRLYIALIFVIVAVLSIAPVLILGPAIGWPASLSQPAATQLSSIAATADAVTLGYAVYALYSLAIAPIAILVAWKTTGLRGPLAMMIVAFGALSALSRLIGIFRWLTVMPLLATNHATADTVTQRNIEQLFSAINAYGGGIGELLGVALFGGLWLAIAMIAAIRNRTLPLWLSAIGIVSALLQISLALPALGMKPPVSIAVAVTLFAIWLIAFAVSIIGMRK
jgi:hypothetical protein